MTLYIYLILLVAIVWVCISTMSDAMSNSELYRSGWTLQLFKHVNSDDPPTVKEHAASVMHCAALCYTVLEDHCRGFFFNMVKGRCSLYNVSLHSIHLVDDGGTTGYKFLPEVYPFDCDDIMNKGNNMDGVYRIKPRDESAPRDVYCEFSDNSAWLVIQRRADGSGDFHKTWNDYRNGFGDLKNEFWLGNYYVHKLTIYGNYELRIDLEDFEGNWAYAFYEKFALDSEDQYFRLKLEGYTGTAGDSFSYHNGMNFSTHDRDLDPCEDNCAELKKGGWWYNSCQHCNLNGEYHHGNTTLQGRGVNWYAWLGRYYSLKTTVMKIREMSSSP